MKKVSGLAFAFICTALSASAQDTTVRGQHKTHPTYDSMPATGDTTMRKKNWEKKDKMKNKNKEKNNQPSPMTDSLRRPE